MNIAAIARTQALLARRGSWSGGKPRRGLVPILIALPVAATFTATFLILFSTLASLGASLEVVVRVLGWAFTFAFVLLALGDLLTVVSAAATAPDLERLLATPLRPRELLLLKFIDTLPRTLGSMVIIALPAAFSYAWVFGGVNPLALVLALFALWAIPLGIGSALAMPLLQVAPATRLRESIAVLATLAFVGGWLANTFWMPRLLANIDVASGLAAIPPLPPWSPATWAAEAMARGGARGWEAMIACAIATVIALLLAATLAERLLTHLQAGAVATPGTLVRGSVRRAATLGGAFLRRDLALFTRDWPVLLDLFARLALWTLLPLAVLPIAPLSRPELVRDMLVTLTLSLGNDIATRALPLERHSLAWARLSPVGGANWVLRRALGVGLLGLAILAVGATVAGAALGLTPLGIVNAFVFALPAGATALALGLLLGATLADPEWRDPRTMLGPGGRTVSAFVMLAQGGWWVYTSFRIGGVPASPLALAALVLAGGLVAWAALALTARAIERREYTAR